MASSPSGMILSLRRSRFAKFVLSSNMQCSIVMKQCMKLWVPHCHLQISEFEDKQCGGVKCNSETDIKFMTN
jgi:hypothetical protein